jgi:hypothetical protein
MDRVASRVGIGASPRQRPQTLAGACADGARKDDMSNHYATSVEYGGQRVSVTRNVVVKYKGDICMGAVVAISLDGQRPIIRMLSDNAADGSRDSAFGFRDGELSFAEVRTEEDIEKAPDRCWFWPPRVEAAGAR